ncbi:MAG: sigma 54-interacting transcriptional regulator [Bryobacterales bacterium]|nr:sigma 54-interacting transcriptional regulator [Bryobacterales bacterium]
MSALSARNRRFLEAVNRVASANPFLPELAEAERSALGPEYIDEGGHWSLQVDDPQKLRANAWRICDKLEALMPDIRDGVLARRSDLTPRDAALFESGAAYMLYHRLYPRLAAEFNSRRGSATSARWGFYREFEHDWRHWLLPPDGPPLTAFSAPHMFALFFQLVRAFHQIFENIIGNSLPAGRLRAAVWQSIFTHDLDRYRRTLYARMADLVTLVTGPSGTGKELVARAIAFSRYVPFDPRTLRFEDDPASHFHPIHIAAFTGSLVESELFGHRRGAFTGATESRKGWLETCPPLGAVFLDEIGELAPEVQVKLLRMIETREFYAVGDSVPKIFEGKLIAATNRDLAAEMQAGHFREDFYYRLCSDLIRTPSLSEQIEESPAVLRNLVRFLALRIAGQEGDELALEAMSFITNEMPRDYQWPGNYRELEQCIRNILVRREYAPRFVKAASASDVFDGLREGRLTAEELLKRYVTSVYARSGSYEGAAERLGLDRRTVKAKVDPSLLERLRAADGAH